MRRSLLVLSFLSAASLAACGGVTDVVPEVEVIKVSGLMDQVLLDFTADAIERAAVEGVELVVLQLDSPGAVADPTALIELVSAPPVALVVWIGDVPAVAYGGAGTLYQAAPLRAAAPGAMLGYLQPLVAGDTPTLSGDPLDAKTVELTTPGPLADLIEPSLVQLIGALDGQSVLVGGNVVNLDLGEDTELGVVRFNEPGLWDRTLRLAVSPEVAFFLLVTGLAVAAFEFYALGPGVAAGVAALALLLSGYGLSNLPVRWWALILALLSCGLMTWGFQRAAGLGWRGILGALGLLVSGRLITDAAPQFEPSWLAVVLSVAVAIFFFGVALPAVTRARLMTETVGREDVVGRKAVALGPFADGDGVVDVDGARWQASSHREATIDAGDELLVMGIQGVYLEVEPVVAATEGDDELT